MGQGIPLACQEWATTKAAKHLMSNARVSEAEILAGHFRSTGERMAAHGGLVLMLHDTTEFSYRQERPEAIGITKSIKSGKDKEGRLRIHTVCGIMMHSSLAVTSDGLPLGLAVVKFWTRDKFKGTAVLKRSINRTRVPIQQKESVRWPENLRQSTRLMGDPARCVDIGVRESDIYELFCDVPASGTPFLARICADRLACDGGHDRR